MSQELDFGTFLKQINAGVITPSEREFYEQLGQATLLLPQATASDGSVSVPTIIAGPEDQTCVLAYTDQEDFDRCRFKDVTSYQEMAITDYWDWLAQTPEIGAVILNPETTNYALTRDHMTAYYDFCRSDDVLLGNVDAHYDDLKSYLTACLPELPQVKQVFLVDMVKSGQQGLLVILDADDIDFVHHCLSEVLTDVLGPEGFWTVIDYQTDNGRSIAADYEPFYVSSASKQRPKTL